jgi:uncharacterized protein YutE (UPF0331/DUF86 family)
MQYDDVIINKVQSIQRCIMRVNEEYNFAQNDFFTQWTHQDAVILNIIRACEQTIDLANYLIKKHQLGIPTSSRNSFELLAEHDIISTKLSQKLQNMVSFRNIAIHEYQQLNLNIVVTIITTDLQHLVEFSQIALQN